MAIDTVRRNFIAAVGAAAATWPLAAARAQQPAAVATSGNETYKIAPLDVLDVTVIKVPDLSKTVQVEADGTITYPLIGQVPAAGKTAHELARHLEQKLGDKYLRSPQITIVVKEHNSR